MNINDHVYVTLTDTGRAVVDRAGYVSSAERRGQWQLWRLMQVFGPELGMGIEPHFLRNEVTFEKESPPMQHERPITEREQLQLDSFDYHVPDQFQIANIAAVRKACKDAALVLLLNVPDSADRTVAIRHLRDAMMSANAAIVLRGK